MNIFAIDTTTKFLCLGIYDDGKIYEYNLEVGKKLSALISVAIQRVLESLKWKAGDIDYFACGVGPGSFTGMRVGVATIKGLSLATQKPVIGVPTLDIIAGNAPETDKPIVTAVDAKRNLMYCSVYKKSQGCIKRLKPYMLLSEMEFFKTARPGSIILGDAINVYKGAMQAQIKGAAILDRDYWYPRPRNIITLALEKIKNNKLSDAFSINPIYLYPKECQVRK